MISDAVFDKVESGPDYHRTVAIYRSIEDCCSCGTRNLCLGFDATEGKYQVTFICLPCFEEFIGEQ